MKYKLEFDKNKYTIKNVVRDGISLDYRAFENIVYVENPKNENYQKLSIYVPEVYYNGEEINGYNIDNAPIFMPNTVGGYMPGRIEEPGVNFKGETNSAFFALLRGYIVVSPAVRGREMQNNDGEYIGCAPAVIVDLKAAVRYLRLNKDRIPGDVEKIISNGTSAGGAISALLGASGNHKDYELYLNEIGAANERDDIFAASCYCPITNLENADMAYEWEFNGLNDYHRMKFEHRGNFEKPKMIPIHGVMSEEQEILSKELKNMFPKYLNSLNLKSDEGEILELDEAGNGSFKEYIKKYVLLSVKESIKNGVDISQYKWIDLKDGEPHDINFEDYVAFRTRMKETPAFDNVELGTPENELFGTKNEKYRHFTDFSFKNSKVNGAIADNKQIYMMNPMNYIGDKSCKTADNYRIRHGAIDRDTSLAISAMLTLSLRENGVNVDYHLPWGVPHSGDYDLQDLFNWIDEIVK